MQNNDGVKSKIWTMVFNYYYYIRMTMTKRPERSFGKFREIFVLFYLPSNDNGIAVNRTNFFFISFYLFIFSIPLRFTLRIHELLKPNLNHFLSTPPRLFPLPIPIRWRYKYTYTRQNVRYLAMNVCNEHLFYKFFFR